jgi:hypothetical protein
MGFFPRGRVWSSALHAVPDGFVPGDPLGPPVALFRPLAAGWPGALHTLADPFLLVRGERIYLFMEAESRGRPGRIVCRSSADGISFRDEGTVLEASHHLSYPFVFDWEGDAYMIPESAAAGEVSLFRFRDFPRGLEKVRVLLSGAFVDSALLVQDGLAYLFTSSERGLHLFWMRDLLGDEPVAVPRVSSAPELARCGGAPIRAGGRLYRLAQQAGRHYGERLAACEVDGLSRDAYEETVFKDDILPRSGRWSAAGGHHMSLARFKGRSFVAVDGQADEPFWLWAAKQPGKFLARGAARVQAAG